MRQRLAAGLASLGLLGIAAAPAAAAVHHPFTLHRAQGAAQQYVRTLWTPLIPAQTITARECHWIGKSKASCSVQLGSYGPFPLYVEKGHHGHLKFIDPAAV